MNPIAKLLASGAFLVLLLGGLITLFDAAYTLDETEQAVVLQFGRPVGETVTEPGLHWKTPFVQEVRVFDKRLIAWDGDPNQIPTRGREFISVDATARWRIVDPLQFLKSMRDETGARTRLDDILDSVVRDKISSTELVEIVRSADWKVTEQDLAKEAAAADKEREELTRRVEVGREQLTRAMLEEARKAMPSYGIELVDVRIKRLNYIESVEKQVFARMISERQRAAEQFRSEGQGDASRIAGETARLLAEIRSDAQRQAEIIRGQADAETTKIYAQAYGADADFYAFWRSLQSYRQSLGNGAVLMLSPDSHYLRYLMQLGGGGGSGK